MRLSREEVERRIKLLNTPVDFERLIEDGVLARDGAWFRILDHERVPQHLWVQIGELKVNEGVLSFRFPGREPGDAG